MSKTWICARRCLDGSIPNDEVINELHALYSCTINHRISPQVECVVAAILVGEM
jgi:hypothetical protein